MKTFTLYESVPAFIYCTITVQAENAEDAVHKYLDNPSDYQAVIIATDEDYDNALIENVEEEEEEA
jgi:hypothetical protein